VLLRRMEALQQRSNVAVRVARHYRRRKRGLAVLNVECDIIALTHVLVAARMLDQNKTDDRAAIVQALQKLIARLATTETN
jgi:hypothetical protein